MRFEPLLGLAAVAAWLALTVSTPAYAQSSSPADPRAKQQAPQKPAGQSPPAGKPADHAHHQPEPAAPDELPPFIPRLTDEDRKAAFPDVGGHVAHDRGFHSFVLIDQLEWQAAGDARGLNLDSKGWIGGDRNRLWFRAEGDSEEGRVGEAQVHALFGRQVSRWWDLVGGIRQDFRPGPAQTWAAVGLQGLAPYWFEIEATAYVGQSGRTHARFEVEYDLRLTNRAILQPLVEVELVGKSDPERGVGAGLSTTDVGFRVRYEIRRELAPYAGVAWSRKWGKTADFAEAAGESTGGARLVTGVRLWF